MRIFDDEALATLSTIYRRSTGAGTQPNPLLPNAGRQTALTANAASGDTVINVVSTAGFQVGDLIPIRDATNYRYRVITAINAGAGTLTLDLTLGVGFSAATATVGAPEMRGHIWGWLDTVLDPFAEFEDIASARRSPPLQIPMSLPASVVTAKDEGTSLGQFSVLNFLGTYVTSVDAGSGQLNVTIADPVQLITQVATTSGTSVDVTGIPAWVKRITVVLNAVSTNGTSKVMLQLGDSGGVETTGYTGVRGSPGVASTAFSSGFDNGHSFANAARYGTYVLTLEDAAANLWVCTFSISDVTNINADVGSGSKSTSAALDRIRLTTVNGTDTFDAGTISVLYG